jgi:hypothetical protein
MNYLRFAFQRLICVLAILAVSLSSAVAQCPMCKATVESSLNSGDNAAVGLNDGIFLLLGMPFLAALTVGLLWYRKQRKAAVAGA